MKELKIIEEVQGYAKLHPGMTIAQICFCLEITDKQYNDAIIAVFKRAETFINKMFGQNEN